MTFCFEIRTTIEHYWLEHNWSPIIESPPPKKMLQVTPQQMLHVSHQKMLQVFHANVARCRCWMLLSPAGCKRVSDSVFSIQQYLPLPLTSQLTFVLFTFIFSWKLQLSFDLQMTGQEEMSLFYEKMVNEIESHIHLMANPNICVPHLQQLMQAITLARNTLDRASAAQLVQKVSKSQFFFYTRSKSWKQKVRKAKVSFFLIVGVRMESSR